MSQQDAVACVSFKVNDQRTPHARARVCVCVCGLQNMFSTKAQQRG